MKSLSKYLFEKVGDLSTGWWEDFEDEDTGEVIKIWREHPPKEIINFEKEIEEEELKLYDEFEKKRKSLDKSHDALQDKISDIEDEISNLNSDIRQLKNRKIDLLSDMEQEVGNLMHDETASAGASDDKGNEYGAELDKIEEQIDKLLDERDKKEEELNSLNEEDDKYWDKIIELDKLEEKSKLKLKPKKEKLQQMIDDWQAKIYDEE